MTLFNKIKKLRDENGLTQEELADKLNISRQTLNNIESGHTKTNVENAMKIAKELNCDVNDIFKIE